MTRYRMLANIRAHSVMVARVALFLATELNRAGAALDPSLTVAAALLHDIGKTQCLQNGGDHSKLGRDICIAHQHDELAEIVAEHVILADGGANLQVCEKQLIYYADKRVNHDRIVSLDERKAYISKTYGKGDGGILQAIRENFAICREVEGRIFSGLALSPYHLAEAVMALPSPFSGCDLG